LATRRRTDGLLPLREKVAEEPDEGSIGEGLRPLFRRLLTKHHQGST